MQENTSQSLVNHCVSAQISDRLELAGPFYSTQSPVWAFRLVHIHVYGNCQSELEFNFSILLWV